MKNKMNVLLSSLLLYSVVNVVYGKKDTIDQDDDKCCKAITCSWTKFDSSADQSVYECPEGYELPNSISDFDYDEALKCVTSQQEEMINNPANGYFLLTETTLENCQHRYHARECHKYLMVCVKCGM